MFKALSPWFGFSLCILGYFCATNNPAVAEARLALEKETAPSLLAQVTSDDTVNTQVTENGNTAEITGGETRGDNLFHSFQDFSVGTGNEAAFLNANDISNIFSRVTGGDISNIDGLISANGSANLFLINPAGIVFGEGASLDIGGSFYGSSASSILFEDGEFSATDLDNPPLLTINAPIGLGFRDQPGDIVNRSDVSGNNALAVSPGETIALIGGNVTFDGGIVFAPGGNVRLGGLTESGIIGLTEDNNLSFPDAIARGNVSLTNSSTVFVSPLVDDTAQGQAGNIELNTASLTVNNGSRLFASGDAQDRGGNVTIDATEDVSFANGSDVFVAGAEGGSIQLDAKSLSITASNFFNGISRDSGFAEAQSGDININTTDNVVVDGQSSNLTTIDNSVSDNAIGNAGEINIFARNISLSNGGGISSFVTGQGNSSDISLNARENISINGSNDSFNSEVISSVQDSGAGNSGTTSITAQNLTLSNGGQIQSSVAGVGDSGDININVKDSLAVDGEGIFANKTLPSQINSNLGFDTRGSSGDINITTTKLSLTDGGQINVNTYGTGNAGNIDINSTESITINGIGSQGGNFSGINSKVLSTAEGNGGNIQISTGDFTVSNNAIVDGSTSGRGNGGEINITANNLFLTNGGDVGASTLGQDPDNITQGNAGDITIKIADTLSIAGTATVDFQGQVTESPAGIVASNLGDRIGNAGNIDVTASKLSLTNGGQISSFSRGKGNAGNITINAEDSILLDKGNEAEVGTGIFTGLEENGVGNGGGININTNNLSILNNAVIQNSIFGEGDGGEINITATNLSLTNGGSIDTDTFGIGNAGSININATESVALDGIYSGIDSTVLSTAEGNSGKIQISTGDFTISNSAGVNANTFGRGNAGNIDITATNLSLTNGGGVVASNSGIDADNIAQGNGGNITINVAETLNINGTFQGQEEEVVAGIFASNAGNSIGNAGNIDITASKLSLSNGSQINSFSRGRGNAGNITINAEDSVLLDAGNELEVDTLISTDLEENGVGNGGEININTNNLSILNDAIIQNTTFGEGNAGNTTINAQDSIVLSNNSSISTEAGNNANGGNLTIDTNFIVAFPNQNNDIIANAEQGNGGNITINAESVFGIEERPLNDSTNDINASSNVFGFDGTINVNTSDINPIQGATELPSNVVELQQNVANACEAGRGTANNGLAIAGKGGVPPAPDTPLNSENIISSEQNPAAFAIPEPIETSQGKIQPARGIKVSKSGKISLTAYRTNNAGERIPEIQPNCH